jgi:hypothetical protein
LYAQDDINLKAGIKALEEKNPFQISSTPLSKVADKG